MAKLRMHNDLTLDIMEAATTSLGKKLREFTEKTCSAFDTKELRREYNARVRKPAKKTARASCQTVNTPSSNSQPTSGPETAASQLTPVVTNDPNSESIAPSSAQGGRQPGRRRKTLNLSTFKAHSLGDYADAIRTYGTTDSYSTEPVRDQPLFPFGHC
jgi:hypothetical protein